MATEPAAGRSFADLRVESAPLDSVLRQLKNGAPTCTPEGTSARTLPSWGGPLSESDYATLGSSWITREIADAAMLRRVDESEGREVVGRSGKLDCAGILFPYYWPGEVSAFNYRIRRDKPELTLGKDGKLKTERKYLGPPNCGNRLFIPPSVTLEQLADVQIPIALVEGEKKCLALLRLAQYETAQPRFIPVAIGGVWSWRGRIGKTGGPKGDRLDVKGPIADLSRIEWNGRRVFIIFDSNVQTNDSVSWARRGLSRELITRAAEVELVNLPEDCGVNGVDDLLAAWGPARVLELFDNPVRGARTQVVLPPQFQLRPEGMFRVVNKGERLSQTQLSNYRASIKTDITLDDGLDTKREFEIESELTGRSFQFTITASQFSGMDWVIERLGPAAITYPNQREYARTAIQWFSLMAEHRLVYAHTGWRNKDGQWLYLHAGGAVGPTGPVSGINVRLPGALARYELRQPSGPDALTTAVRASLALVELGPPSISFPLRAATCRAVFGNSDFALHVAGETGAFKSELAALEQQHFGPGMNRLHLPGAWSSTANAIEALTFQAKDALIVIDDFAPQGSAADIGRYHAAADRVFRAAGNHAGRGRLDSTAMLREAKPPRGLILSTGEEVPRGHSVRARLLILELSKGDVDSKRLTQCQTDAEAGRYAEAMGAFVCWIASRYEELIAELSQRVTELRLQAANSTGHARTPEIIANLQAGFELYLAFSHECEAIDHTEREQLAGRCWQALLESAEAQSKHQAATEPTIRFLRLLRGALSSGRAHLASREGTAPGWSPESCGWRRDSHGNWFPLGDCVGWIDGEEIYVEPTAAFRVVQTAGRDSGEVLAVSESTLKRRLRDKGLLASTDAKRQTLTIRRTIAGSSKDVLHFCRSTLLPEVSDGDEDAE